MDNYPSLLSIPLFPVALVFARYPEILSDVLEILGSRLLWRFFLPACIMVDSICLSVLHWHPLSLPYWSYGNHHMCECAQSFIDPYEIILLAQTSFRTWVGSRYIKPSMIVRISLFNLYTPGQNISFWYPLLEIRIPLNLSIELFGCFYHLMPLHEFFPWLSVDTHIRFLAVHQILWWIIVRLILHI